MSHFERTEGAEDNLGEKEKNILPKNQRREYVEVGDLADESALTPDEIIMQREDEEEANGGQLKDGDKSVFNKEDFDFTPSVWENEVDAGKYDPKPEDYKLKVADDVTIIPSFKTQDRGRVEQITKLGQQYRDAYPDSGHLPKRQKPKPKKDTIRKLDKAS